MSSNEPSLLLRLNLIVSDITDRVNAGAVEILEIVSKYEEELCLAKEEIVRQRNMLDALQDMTDRMNAVIHTSSVPQQHTPTPDVHRSELQHSPDLPACEQNIPHEQLLGDQEVSNNPHVSVYSVSLTNLQFEELTKSLQTGNGDHPDHCHEGEEIGRPLEAHDVSQIDLGLIKEEEEPMSIHTGAERCQSTPDATEDHVTTSSSSPGFDTERKILTVSLHRIPCMEWPSSPDQKMKDELLEPLIPTDGGQPLSPPQLIALTPPSQKCRGDQGRKRSSLEPRRRSKRKPADRTAADCTAADCSAANAAVQTASNADFQKHVKTESPYNCQVCGKGFKEKKRLTIHRYRHKESMCPICLKNVGVTSLKRHMLIHTGERQYSCNVCGRAFMRRDHFREHMARHARDTRDKPFVCSTCGRRFGQKHVLERHKKIHAGEKSHHRPISRKGVDHSSNLDVPMLTSSHVSVAKRAKVKKSSKPTFCPICQKYIQSNFGRHLLVHSGEKPHSCEFCGKRFGRKDHLNKHICFTDSMS